MFPYHVLHDIVNGWEINCYLNTLVALATKKYMVAITRQLSRPSRGRGRPR